MSSPAASRSIIYRGLDVHKDSVTIAVLPADAAAPTRIDTYQNDLPVKPGVQRTHDQYDAGQRARRYRAGERTVIRMPSEAEESVRDVVRCRETLQRDVVKSRHDILKVLARRGFVYRGGIHWRPAHYTWLRQLTGTTSPLAVHDQVMLANTSRSSSTRGRVAMRISRPSRRCPRMRPRSPPCHAFAASRSTARWCWRRSSWIGGASRHHASEWRISGSSRVHTPAAHASDADPSPKWATRIAAMSSCKPRGRIACIRRLDLADGARIDIQWAPHSEAAAVQDVRVQHRGRDVLVPQQLLDRADVVAGFQQMGREGMSERMTTHALGNAAPLASLGDRALQDSGVEVVGSCILRADGTRFTSLMRSWQHSCTRNPEP